MSNFTITSWNGCNPQHFDTWAEASVIAQAKAAQEGSIVYVTDNLTDEACEVDRAGNIGKWMTADIN